jgi:hypothetical protein
MAFTQSNIEEFRSCLADFSKPFQKSFMRQAYMDAAKPLIQEARATTISKRVKQSIGAKYYEDGSPEGYLFVGARISKVWQGYLARWEEEGTKERVQKKTGRRTGKITASWFFNLAVNKTQGQIFDSLYNSVTGSLVKTINKWDKKKLV